MHHPVNDGIDCLVREEIASSGHSVRTVVLAVGGNDRTKSYSGPIYGTTGRLH